jgi:hypothetical protein
MECRRIMAIDKGRLITLVSRGTNSHADAARALGIVKKTIGNWPLDDEGRVTSEAILSKACRALMRQYWLDVRAGRQPMHVPEEDIQALIGLDSKG